MPQPQQSNTSGKAIVAVVVLALVGGGAWLALSPSSPPEQPNPSPEQGGAADDWRKAWATAGFTGARAVLPGARSPTLDQAAKSLKDAAGVQAQLDSWRSSKQLQPVSLREARRHGVRPASALFGEVVESRAKPAHPVEAAWLARALCEAAGLTCAFVADAEGVQTPLILSHTRVGVQVAGGPVLRPLGAALVGPKPVSDAEMAAWWLVVRAQAERGRSDYKRAHADLALAARLAPDAGAPGFARGVVQIDQGLLDRGLDTCELALSKHEDPFARLFLADVLAAMEKPFKAYQHVQKVTTAHPKLAEGHVSLALLDAGRAQTAPEKGKAALLAKAKAGFERGLALDPKVPGARAGLAQLALLEGDQGKAESLLKAAVEQHGDAQSALVLAELLGMSQRSAEAVTMLRKLNRSDDERFAQALIKALAVSGEVDDAMKEAAAAVKRFPRVAQVALLYADLLRQRGKAKEAIAVLEPHADGAQGEQIGGLQIQLLLQAGEHAKALARLEPMLKAKPQSKELALLGVVAYTIAAAKAKRTALWKGKVAAGVLSWLEVAGVLIEAGDAAEAEVVLQAGVAALAPTSEEGQQLTVMLAMVMTASQRKADAVKLRDAQAAKIPDEAARAALAKAVDQAIAGAEAELTKMAQEGEPGGVMAPAEPAAP